MFFGGLENSRMRMVCAGEALVQPRKRDRCNSSALRLYLLLFVHFAFSLHIIAVAGAHWCRGSLYVEKQCLPPEELFLHPPWPEKEMV